MKRRESLKLALLGGFGLGLSPYMTNAQDKPNFNESSFPEIGESFSEAKSFPDPVSLKETTSILTKAYIRHECWLQAGKHLIISHCDVGKETSALLLANTLDFSLMVLAKNFPADQLHFNGGAAPFPDGKFVAVVLGDVYTAMGKEIRVYDVSNPGNFRTVFRAEEGYFIKSIASNAKGVYFTLVSNYAHPSNYSEEFISQLTTSYFFLDPNSFETEVLFVDFQAGNLSLCPHPDEKELFLTLRSYPPKFGQGPSPKNTTTLYHLSSQNDAFKGIFPVNGGSVQEAVWTSTMQALYVGLDFEGKKDKRSYLTVRSTFPTYSSLEGLPFYLGALDKQGKRQWELNFPYFYPGHISTLGQENQLLVSGLLTPDLSLMMLFSNDLKPSFETKILARSGVQQAGRSSPMISADGRWLAYTISLGKENQVRLVRIENG